MVIVYCRRFRRDVFYSENELSAKVYPNHGTLIVELSVDGKTETHSYNATEWRRVVSKQVPVRSQV